MDGTELSAAEGRFVRLFLVGLRCLVYESRWPGVDPRAVALEVRDRYMREEQEAVGVLFGNRDWVALLRRYRSMPGPTAAQLAEIVEELAGSAARVATGTD